MIIDAIKIYERRCDQVCQNISEDFSTEPNRHANADGLIPVRDNPAIRVPKPRRHTNSRRALLDSQLAQINAVVRTTGDDPDLDTLLLRLHLETACRRGGASRP
ncbi:hypothetical protein GCM10010123_09240 [Pilimelia anulata]|uniref:Uncharacterized protein n=1 Tax=Pilimelia anulata TaxID=53371 RepID=A0A8J3B0P4_9ACTN|nr:hypothetical protein GCM10010123_09240 [Pilimelia anulata]